MVMIDVPGRLVLHGGRSQGIKLPTPKVLATVLPGRTDNWHHPTRKWIIFKTAQYGATIVNSKNVWRRTESDIVCLHSSFSPAKSPRGFPETLTYRSHWTMTSTRKELDCIKRFTYRESSLSRRIPVKQLRKLLWGLIWNRQDARSLLSERRHISQEIIPSQQQSRAHHMPRRTLYDESLETIVTMFAWRRASWAKNQN